MLLHDVRQCNADLVHTPPGSGGCGEHGEQSVTGLDVAAAAPVWRPLAASVASVALPMKFSSVSRLLLHWPAHWHHRDHWCWGHWPLVSTQAGASTWSCSNIANTMLGLVRRSSPVSPISSVPLRQQMWWRAVRCPPINTLHGYRDAGPALARLQHSWLHCSHHPSSLRHIFPFLHVVSTATGHQLTSSAAQGREKRWFILLSIAIETIFQYPWYMVDIRL